MNNTETAHKGHGRELPSVFAFLDHRIFLREWFETKKELTPSYSYRVFARKAGFASHAFLSEVMQGRRNLSEESIEKFLKALGLIGLAADFFRLLVHYGQELHAGRREDLLAELLRTQATLAVGRVSKKQEAYFSHWMHPVVRELAVQMPAASAESIASRLTPAVSQTEVQESLALLETLGLLEKTPQGQWAYGLGARLTPGDVPQEILRALKRQYLMAVQDRIATGSDPDAHASSVILSVSRSRMGKIRDQLEKLRQEILAETATDEDPTERVVLVNVQMVPLTRNLLTQL